MKKEFIDVTSYTGDGYQPMIDFKTWRVAVLRYCEELEIGNLKTMQMHNDTDEVFVLLNGSCTLFTGGNRDFINEIDGVAMKPMQLYNVKQGTWHTHTLDREATVLIIENRDTSDQNSPTLMLSAQQMEQLRSVFAGVAV